MHKARHVITYRTCTRTYRETIVFLLSVFFTLLIFMAPERLGPLPGGEWPPLHVSLRNDRCKNGDRGRGEEVCCGK